MKSLTLPSKAQILRRATELYYKEALKSSEELPNIPEVLELQEEGYFDVAKLQLMSNPSKRDLDLYYKLYS